MELPARLEPFVGSLFTVDGAEGGILSKQIQAIELLDEIPEGAKKGTVSWREALYRKLDRDETIAIFAALGFFWSMDDFEDYKELSKRRTSEGMRRAAEREKAAAPNDGSATSRLIVAVLGLLFAFGRWASFGRCWG